MLSSDMSSDGLSAKEHNIPVKPKLLVVFGATGNLFAKKLAKALWLTWSSPKRDVAPWDTVVCTGTKQDWENEETFRSFLTTTCQIKKECAEFQEFSRTFSFVRERCSEEFDKIGQQITEWIKKQENAGIANPEVYFYFGIWPKVFASTLKQMQTLHIPALKERLPGLKVHILFEKPSAIRIEDLETLRNACVNAGIDPDKEVHQVDHFCFKPGFRAAMNWLYLHPTKVVSFTGRLVKEVVIEVVEELDSQGRDYIGVMLDSVYSHCMVILAMLLASPIEATTVAQGLEVSLDQLLNGRSRLLDQDKKSVGLAAICRTDPSCPQDTGNLTGVQLSFWPNVPRYPGNTKFTILNQKCGPCKKTAIHWIFRGTDGLPEYATFYISNFPHGSWLDGLPQIECVGFDRIMPGFNMYGNGSPIREQKSECVDPTLADGYPTLMREWLSNDFTYFLSLSFQEKVIALLHNWARTIHFSAKSGLKYPHGTYAFRPPPKTGCGTTIINPRAKLATPCLLDLTAQEQWDLLADNCPAAIKGFIKLGLLSEEEIQRCKDEELLTTETTETTE